MRVSLGIPERALSRESGRIRGKRDDSPRFWIVSYRSFLIKTFAPLTRKRGPQKTGETTALIEKCSTKRRVSIHGGKRAPSLETWQLNRTGKLLLAVQPVANRDKHPPNTHVHTHVRLCVFLLSRDICTYSLGTEFGILPRGSLLPTRPTRQRNSANWSIDEKRRCWASNLYRVNLQLLTVFKLLNTISYILHLSLRFSLNLFLIYSSIYFSYFFFFFFVSRNNRSIHKRCRFLILFFFLIIVTRWECVLNLKKATLLMGILLMYVACQFDRSIWYLPF